MYLAGSEAEPPSFHHFLIGSLGSVCKASPACHFLGQWIMTMRKNLVMARNQRKTVEVRANHKMDEWPLSLEWLWISCVSPEFTFSEVFLDGNFSASQFSHQQNEDNNISIRCLLLY